MSLNPSLTVVIRHPVSITDAITFGVPSGFPSGDEYLTPALVHRVILTMIAAGISKFEDGIFHANVHPFGMADLLATTSAAQADEQGIRRLNSKPDKTFVSAFGIRWEVDPQFRDVRVFGPHSNPENVLLIDLTETP